MVVALTIDRAGLRAPGTLTVFDVTGPTACPPGAVPSTVAVLTTWPTSTSACTVVWLPVHVVDTPGASVVVGQVTTPVMAGSVTVIVVMVTSPMLVTRNE